MELETNRLIIRYFEETDGADLYDYLSKDEVVKYEPYKPMTREQAETEAIRRKDDKRFYAVALKSGKMIGNFYFSQEDFDTWEFGYVFNSDYWKKGFAFEGAELLIDYVFHQCQAHRIKAVCNPLNANSWRLLEKLGFRREGELLKNVYFFKDDFGNPIWQDTYEYGMLKDEWSLGEKAIKK